ncbi:hypothetical protein [Thermoactinospora rubra]|uniref:hypothetical protein n=1 Tax=Thermoactinospora rubra TaxID=1088767 RepID=UPI001301E1B6|nr:hypothetical protein [Thermoactinospora rubra]
MTDDDLAPPDTPSLEAWIFQLLQLTGPRSSGEAATRPPAVDDRVSGATAEQGP